jgi:hypothetical protein
MNAVVHKSGRVVEISDQELETKLDSLMNEETIEHAIERVHKALEEIAIDKICHKTQKEKYAAAVAKFLVLGDGFRVAFGEESWTVFRIFTTLDDRLAIVPKSFKNL